MKPAIPIKKPAPLFDRRGNIVGDSAVSLTILADGALGDIQLIGRGGQSLDRPTLEAVKKWKFKPAMCGSEPVVSDLQVVFGVRKN
jgi:TonB family protein